MFEEFPAEVVLVRTPRDMFWAQSMVFGYEQIIRDGFRFDYLIAANDDIDIRDNSVNELLNSVEEFKINGKNAVIVGAFSNIEGTKFTYGGQRSVLPFLSSVLSPLIISEEMQKCDSFNMNLVIFPYQILEKYGFLSNDYIHGLADFDYGLRLSRLGVQIYQSKSYIGTCEKNSVKGSPFDTSLSILNRYKVLLSPKYNPLGPTFCYTKRHSGRLFFVHMLYIYLSPLFTSMKNMSKR